MSTYAVGDIHGCYDQWMELKNRIEKDDGNAKFILVGDIIDRGPKTIEMINWAKENITSDGKYQMVLGNHEHEKILWWDLELIPIARECQYNGVELTLDMVYADRYGFSEQFTKNGLGVKECREAISWFRTLPFYKDIVVNNQRFLIAHANIPYSIINEDNTLKTELDKKSIDFILWDRDPYNFEKIRDVILINGHTPTIIPEAFPYYITSDEYFGKIFRLPNRYNIDCGAVFKGQVKEANLAALRLDDLKEIYLYND